MKKKNAFANITDTFESGHIEKEKKTIYRVPQKNEVQLLRLIATIFRFKACSLAFPVADLG